MEDIDQYLKTIYTAKNNYKLYNKMYYLRYKKRILDYNNKRYNDRLKKGRTKFNLGQFVIKFD